MTETMKLLTRGLLLALIVIPISLSAQVIYSSEGVILGYSNQSINLSDIEYRLLPTTKVFLKKNRKGKLSDLKLGEYARVSLIKIDKKRYVDSIQVIQNLQPNEDNVKRE